jgi:glycosyltransferase involved in cell wall biosynthesis
MGNPTYAEQLKSLIARFGIEANVRLLGFVGHEELMERYRKADLAVNRRYPAYEGASASLVEQMGFGKCVLVSNTGVYAEIPDDCLIRIDPENEVSDLIGRLRDLIDRPDIPLVYGRKARSYARDHFSRDGYGKDMTHFLHRMEVLKPLDHLTRQLEQELKTMGATDRMEILETLSTEMETLFFNGIRSTCRDDRRW